MIPAQLTINGSKWKIRVVPQKTGVLKGNDLGDMAIDTHTITIADVPCEEIQREVLYHELGHLMLELTGLECLLDSKLEESICNAFSYFIPQLFVLKGKRGK